jgi:hypothetical protein
MTAHPAGLVVCLSECGKSELKWTPTDLNSSSSAAWRQEMDVWGGGSPSPYVCEFNDYTLGVTRPSRLGLQLAGVAQSLAQTASLALGLQQGEDVT